MKVDLSPQEIDFIMQTMDKTPVTGFNAMQIALAIGGKLQTALQPLPPKKPDASEADKAGEKKDSDEGAKAEPSRDDQNSEATPAPDSPPEK